MFIKFVFSLIPFLLAYMLLRKWEYLLFAGSYFVLLWLFTFGAYGTDKLLAKMQKRRISENFLIALGFIGGTPGAAAGMKIFHHKTAKPRFRKALTGAIVLHSVLTACAAGIMLFR